MKPNHPAIEEFVERLGLVTQGEGLPRTAGRIMGLFVIHGGQFSFAELAEHLKVSRGSISTNTRLLENLRIIERITRAGERQDFFQLLPEPYLELLKGLIGRLQKAYEVVAEAQQKIPGDWSDTQTRLTDLGTFYSSLIKSTESLVNAKPDKKKSNT